MDKPAGNEELPERALAIIAAQDERIATLQAPLVATLEDERQSFRDVQAALSKAEARIARLQAVAVAAHDEWFASSIPSPITIQAALAALQPGDLPT